MMKVVLSGEREHGKIMLLPKPVGTITLSRELSLPFLVNAHQISVVCFGVVPWEITENF